jgi:hypothetical protein
LPAGKLVIEVVSPDADGRPNFGALQDDLKRRRYDRMVYYVFDLTWPELVRLYRLTLDAPARNTQPRYNICPTTNIEVVIERDKAPSLWRRPKKNPADAGIIKFAAW